MLNNTGSFRSGLSKVFFLYGVAGLNVYEFEEEHKVSDTKIMSGDSAHYYANIYNQSVVFNLYRDNGQDFKKIHIAVHDCFVDCYFFSTSDIVNKACAFSVETVRKFSSRVLSSADR